MAKARLKTIVCKRCYGSGKVFTGNPEECDGCEDNCCYEPCPVCKGRGRVKDKSE